MGEIERGDAGFLMEQVQEIEAHLVRPHSPAMRRMGLLWFGILLISGFTVDWDLLHPLMLGQYSLMSIGSVWTWLRRRSADRRIERLMETNGDSTLLGPDIM